jgi:hypothetical protein
LFYLPASSLVKQTRIIIDSLTATISLVLVAGVRSLQRFGVRAWPQLQHLFVSTHPCRTVSTARLGVELQNMAPRLRMRQSLDQAAGNTGRPAAEQTDNVLSAWKAQYPLPDESSKDSGNEVVQLYK